MSEFFRSRGFKVLTAIFVMLFGILIGSLLRNGFSNTVDGVVGVFVTPIRTVSSAVTAFFDDIGDGFKSKSELLNRVDELEKEVGELKNQLADYEETKQENEQLIYNAMLVEELQHKLSIYENLYDEISANESMNPLVATVIGRESGNYFSVFTINKGLKDGVQDYMAVQEYMAAFDSLWKAIRNHLSRMEMNGLITPEVRDILQIAAE